MQFLNGPKPECLRDHYSEPVGRMLNLRQNPYDEILKFTKPFPASSWPAIDCQTCGIGQVQVIAGKTEYFESAESKKLREGNHENWEPEWINGLFQTQLLCSESSCKSHYLAMGNYRLDQLSRRQPNGAEYQEILVLLAAQPSFPISDRLPGETPDLVHERIKEAAKVIWLDPNAAGNRLRLAVEELLTDQGIAKYGPKGTTDYIKTDVRIKKFEEVQPEAAELLFAVKWLGNEGSHGDTLTAEDVVLGVQIFHEALKIVYNSTRQNIVRQAGVINANKGKPR